jgi:hypothetical protein
MFSVDLSTRDGDGHVVVALGGELDLVDAADVAAALMTVTDGAFQSADRNAARRDPAAMVPLPGCGDDR